LPKPSEIAECVVLDGESVWVVNDTLVINSTITINTEVIVYGDLEVTNNGILAINGTTITVFGCLELQNASSLLFTLTPEEFEELENNGILNRTVISFNPLCDLDDFGQVSVTNGQSTYFLRLF
jgi:hypothetical protein